MINGVSPKSDCLRNYAGRNLSVSRGCLPCSERRKLNDFKHDYPISTQKEISLTKSDSIPMYIVEAENLQGVNAE